MTEPNEPQYPQYPPGYPQQPGYPPQQPGYPAPAAAPSLLQRIGSRTVQRPQPRQGVSLAGVGVGLVVIGIVVWGGDFLSGGGGDGGGGGSRQWLGIVLSLAAVTVGYALAVTQRRGPLGTAGVAASALGMPVLLGFLTWDTSGSDLPFSIDAIVIVSVIAWLISYLYVPGARGHGLYLGLSSVLLWIYILDKTEPHLFSPMALFGGVISTGSSDGGVITGGDGITDNFPSPPDLQTVTAISLIFGIAYYVIAFALDHAGRRGTAVPFTVAGVLAIVTGVIAGSSDLHEVGTGILLILFGLVLGRYGAWSGRRFTTWGWSVGAAIGIVVLVGKFTNDNAAAAGVTLVVCGAIVVLGAHLLATALHEPDDVAANGPGTPGIGAQPVP